MLRIYYSKNFKKNMTLLENLFDGIIKQHMLDISTEPTPITPAKNVSKAQDIL